MWNFAFTLKLFIDHLNISVVFENLVTLTLEVKLAFKLKNFV